jgi:hypothetical protein
MVSGRGYWTYFTPLKNLTVSEIAMATGGVVAAGLTLARMGLYTFDGTTLTLVARTASDTSLYTAANTIFTRSFDTVDGYPATYNLVAGQTYAIANIVVGTTPPSVLGISTAVTLTGVLPRYATIISSLEDLPATQTTLTAGSTRFWSRLS